MTHPGGRPRKLTPLMELRIYETITATRIGKRVFACVDLARELGIGVSTVQRILTQQRRAHLARDHELNHLNWELDNEGHPKSDGLGRPKLSTRRHDHQIGYFTDVVGRHGEAALEIRAARYLIAEIGQMKFEFGGSDPKVTMTHDGETVDITDALARIRERSEPAVTL